MRRVRQRWAAGVAEVRVSSGGSKVGFRFAGVDASHVAPYDDGVSKPPGPFDLSLFYWPLLHALSRVLTIFGSTLERAAHNVCHATTVSCQSVTHFPSAACMNPRCRFIILWLVQTSSRRGGRQSPQRTRRSWSSCRGNAHSACESKSARGSRYIHAFSMRFQGGYKNVFNTIDQCLI